MKEFDEEEREMGYHQRVLQGRIDLIRAQLVYWAGLLALSPENLARVRGGEGNHFERADKEGWI